VRSRCIAQHDVGPEQRVNGHDEPDHADGQRRPRARDEEPRSPSGPLRGRVRRWQKWVVTRVGTPDSTIPGQLVDTGGEARAFANVMRKHALEATGGKTYAEMPRFMGKNGQPTNDQKMAAVDPKSGNPVDNGARNIWVTETALTTALNTAYFAEQVALFSIVMGVALLLTGIGFLVLTLRVLHPALATRRRETTAKAVPAAG
jgi:hypothetical protein